MKKYFIPLAISIVVAAASYYLYQKYNPFTYYDDEVHVHADFLIYINDQKIDLTDPKYQSSAEQILHKNVHLHDDEDNVVHRHAEGITFAEFLNSVGFTLTNDCLTLDTAEAFCNNETQVLMLYVNKEPYVDISSYIPQEEDQVLLYYGTKGNPNLNQYLDSITNDSCIYSGTCPERGVAPAESCGLTCEIE